MLDDWENLPRKVPHDFIVVGPQRKYPRVIALDTENAPSGGLGHWSVAFRDEKGRLCVEPFYGPKPSKRFAKPLVIMHNAKWDIRVLRDNKMTPPPNIADSMIAAYCLGYGKENVISEGEGRMMGGLGLKYLARRHLGMEMKTWQEIKDGSPDEIASYNADDSVSTLLLWELWEPNLPQHFWDIDMPLLPVLMEMEDRGIAIDPKFLAVYAEELDKKLAKYEFPFNINSPIQLRKYVYEELGVVPWQFTKKTKLPSTDKNVLEAIRDSTGDETIAKILEYKDLAHDRENYVSSYIERLGADGRIHPEFKQTSTATGRLSCANPNLQNVPTDEMRKLFVAEEGKLLVRADYDQIELRAFAAITGEENMIGAFQEGRKIHAETAYLMGVPYDVGKTLNFLMLYGGTEWGISQKLHIPIEDSKALIRKYFKAYPKVPRYISEQAEQAKKTKKSTNWFGRTRRIDALYAEDWRVRKHGEKEAINWPIQGLAAEIVKLGMIALRDTPMLLQVHDEILFEVDASKAKAFAEEINERILDVIEINGVKFPATITIGKNWYEAWKKKKES